MALEQHKALILEQLRNGRKSVLDEADAWAEILAAANSIKRPSERKADQKRWADEYVFALGLIYARHTGTLPGFTNCQAETRFERFARAVMEDVPIHVSRNLIKAAIRRLDAKHNPRFVSKLSGDRAAE